MNWLRLALLALSLAGPVAVPFASTAQAEDPAGVQERVVGVWDLVPTAEQQAEVAALELAFQDPVPTDEAIQAALDGAAEALALLVVATRRSHPEAGELQTYRASLSGLRSTSLHISPAEMSLDFGTQRSTLRYEVVDENPTALRALTTDEGGSTGRVTLQLRDDDQTLLLVEDGADGQRMQFTRR